MALPIKATVVLGLLRELGKLEDRPLLVAGAPYLVPVLVRDLVAGGDPSAVRTGGSPEHVEALLYILGDEVTEQDEQVLKTARRARVPTIVVAAGIIFAFLFQIFVNVGMTMGIAPITGIPLPFVSVGGSSMIANLIAVGLLLSIQVRARGARR